MSRKDNTMLVLDDVERLLADEVYLFDEESARQQNKDSCPKANRKVGWDIVPIKIDTKVDFVSGDVEVELIETAETARLTKITITGIDKETLVLKPDNCAFRFYKGGTYNKACDYLLLTKFNNYRYAFFIDLKTRIYESQCDGCQLFVHAMENDEKIVWQMIGANTILDSIISVLEKKSNIKHTYSGSKKKSYSSELAKFQRRYIVLYKTADCSGEKEPMRASARQPNENILDSPVCVLKVDDFQELSLADLVYNTQPI